ncbi:hypothetical protein [Sphingomonas sp. 28-63-12]|uniref:hypothetical protein n=1 Tax=Sphingomonas sp. 28-63-12 TaxID=1970434 RepID=UPI0035A995F9
MLAEAMAGSDHFSIDSTTVRAQVSVAVRKRVFIEALLAARGASLPVNFAVWLMQEDDRSPST